MNDSEVKMLKIQTIAKKANIKNFIPYGNYMAKITPLNESKKGKLILVSAMTPTTAGEGKTTIAIALSDALNILGHKSILSLREPSLGPVFGMKGGATGAGAATVEPSNEINLHFTGDFHAITSANNLLCAMLDNSIFQGNPLNINPQRVVFPRAMDMNDRSLRDIDISLEKLKGQEARRDHFVITSACEIMAILCLAQNFDDLKRRLGNILVAYTYDNKPVLAKDLKAQQAMAILLANAIYPNLVQTQGGYPAIIHGGPFANIAHGCSSIIATSTALSLGEYCVTEGGFGGDLGGEKFLSIVSRKLNKAPTCVVVVATVKAIKLHSESGLLSEGFENLKRHLLNFKNVFSLTPIVALNHFKDDSEDDINEVVDLCKTLGISCHVCYPYEKGGKGCLSLAAEITTLPEPKQMNYPYNLEDSVKDKIQKLTTKIYGGKDVEYSDDALEDLKNLPEECKNYPICVAKTQYSFSDDAKKLNAPKDFTLHVKRIEVKHGGEFIVVLAGKIYLMPGLSKEPNAVNMYIDENMVIHNLK